MCSSHNQLNEEVKLNKQAQIKYTLQAKRNPLMNLPN